MVEIVCSTPSTALVPSPVRSRSCAPSSAGKLQHGCVRGPLMMETPPAAPPTVHPVIPVDPLAKSVKPPAATSGDSKLPLVMALACRETPLQAVNMAKARTARELLWCIFCPFELLGRPAQVKSPIPPFAGKRRRNTENSDTLVFAPGGAFGEGKTSGIGGGVWQRFAPFYMKRRNYG